MTKISTLLGLFGVSVLALAASAGEARADTEPAAATASTPAAPATPERLSFAVVVGNNRSLGRRRPDLHYADDDAARYFEILQTVAPGRVTLLADFDRDSERLFPQARAHGSAPTLRNLQAAGKKLAEQVRAARAAGHETELYFVFAGHGDVAEGEGFIELGDAQFRSRDLERWLRAIPFTRAHVILDSCNSFFMLGVRKPGGRHFATSEDAARSLSSRLPNVGVFLSTSAEGEAFEWSEIQSGIFSHVVRSGLLGAADADGDGSVSYVELAAFVDTATADVRNPGMRPHVFARGPGADDNASIARLYSMGSVRRFELAAGSSLRLRLRDANGLPLLDAHTEPSRPLRAALPEAWAAGAVIERSEGHAAAPIDRKFYTVPEAPGTVTLAALADVSPPSAGRGPGETFQTLFLQPFGPQAFSRYVELRATKSTPVYGVSKEDAQRMELVLDQVANFERGKRISEGIGATGFGALLGGAGFAFLDYDDDATDKEKKQAKIAGGVLIGLGGLSMLGGIGSFFATTKGEKVASEFRGTIRAGGDPARAFAVADEELRQLAAKRQAERYALGIFGGLAIVGSATGLIWTEVAADPSDDRTAARLGWSAGIFGGAVMIGDAILMQTPIDSLTNIWQEDPSLNQYRARRSVVPQLSLTKGGAFLSLSGTL
ncbi:MAG TPA: hypothetical protein VGK73_09650 [Polyangiaceae bacterium]